MAKIKLLKSYYNKETGESYIALNTKYGIFEGYSKLHEEDKDIVSEYIGCNYAEVKAIIKYEKTKLINKQKKLKTIKILLNEMEKLNGYNKNSIEARYIRKQYYIVKKEVDEQILKIKYLKNSLYKAMNNYREEKDKFEEKIKKIREKRETSKNIKETK